MLTFFYLIKCGARGFGILYDRCSLLSGTRAFALSGVRGLCELELWLNEMTHRVSLRLMLTS